MQIIVFLLLLVSSFSSLSAFTLKERFASAEEGDYAILKTGSHTSLLLIRSKSPSELMLEEVTFPTTSEKRDFQQYLTSFAPGHTSWTLFILHFEPDSLETYSYDMRSYQVKGDEEKLLPKLLSLSLSPTPTEKRRKVGASPLGDEQDNRPYWSPPYSGTEKALPYLAKWPSDDSPLSDSSIELYFASNLFFPLWIEWHSPHYTAHIELQGSGHKLRSPQPLPLKSTK